ncbi:hypothetical protein NECAME_02086 [Necator americanus]|uniref:Uncharacterized protein n=1 Tax=Necator americanus TaxID=51031 RepID=W2TKY1_NECAM|nr:hypothetical protein NECAME_02086 [Necator americanus]ETN81796.1 hypothetical protein NECAME_02086 [Necator americanus]
MSIWRVANEWKNERKDRHASGWSIERKVDSAESAGNVPNLLVSQDDSRPDEAIIVAAAAIDTAARKKE